MSTRKTRQQKNKRKRLKSEKSCDDANIFVLSPNILAKLGINLNSNVNKSETKPGLNEPSHNGVKINTYSRKQKQNKDNKQDLKDASTSLSETATLMKKSVLLSPSFTNTTIEATSSHCYENNINGENTIKVDINCHGDSTFNKICNDHSKEEAQSVEQLSVHSKIHTSSSIESQKTLRKKESSQGSGQNVDNNISKIIVNDDNCNFITTAATKCDDFIFKVPYSQTVNNNVNIVELELATRHLNNNKISQPNVQQRPSSHDIPIISADVPTVNNCEHNNDSSKTNGSVCLEEEENEMNIDLECINNPIIHDSSIEANLHQIVGKNTNNKKVNDEDFHKSTQDNYSTVENVGNFMTKKHTSHLNRSTTSIENLDKNNGFKICDNEPPFEHTPNIDKVKEIAEYLGKCVKKPALHAKQISKSSVHGVEKPGGKLEVNKSGGKTYQRKTETVPKLKEMDTNCSKLNTASPLGGIDYTDISNVTNELVFCNCNDFGIYELNEFYEHVHFCGKPSLQVCKETLFEIFSEEINQNCLETVNESAEHCVSLPSNDFELLSPICWNVIKINNDKNIEVVTTQTSVNDNEIDLKNIKTSCGNLRSSSAEIVSKNIDIEVDLVASSKTGGTKKGNVTQNQTPHLNEPIMSIEIFDENNGLKTDTKATKDKNKPEFSNIHYSKETENSGEIGTNLDIGVMLCHANLDIENVVKKTSVNCEPDNLNEPVDITDNDRTLSKKVHKSEEASVSTVSKAAVSKEEKIENKGIKDQEINQKEIENSDGDFKLRNDIRSKKRYISIEVEEVPTKKSVRCGVCDAVVSEINWEKHSEVQHCYIAWRAGQTLNLNDMELQQKLDQKVRNESILKCTLCNLEFNQSKEFIKHIEECLKPKGQIESCSIQEDPVSFNDSIDKDINVVCGICNEDVSSVDWYKHSADKHQYLAWRKGDRAIDVNSDQEILQFLQSVSKELNGLKCSNCNIVRKTAKAYMNHMTLCKGSDLDKTPIEEHSVKKQLEQVEFKSSDVASAEDNGTKQEAHSKDGETFLKEETKESDIDSIKSDISAIKPDETEDEDEQSLSILKRKKNETKSRKRKSGVPTAKCGVCAVETTDWIEHISKEHKYIAWKDGEEALVCSDENDVRTHLQNILKSVGELVCFKCGLVRKQARAYLKHIKECDENLSLNLSNSSDIGNDSQVIEVPIVNKCGVCAADVNSNDWIQHIAKKHEYIAWVEGEAPLDIKNEEQIRDHLHAITKQIGGLKCPKCGIVRKYAKQYMIHINSCTGERADVSINVSMTSDVSSDSLRQDQESDTPYICGVCAKEIERKDWIDHITKEHEYIAWHDKETPLNTENKNQIRHHLHNITKITGGLKCPKCGITRKYAKAYITHLETCTGEEVNDSDSDTTLPDDVRCGVCKQEMKRDDWIPHIEEKHNYLAWWDIEDPLNLDDEEEVIEHLRQISYSNGGLKCMKCSFVCKKQPSKYLEHIKSECFNSKKRLSTEVRRTGEIECARCHMKVDVKQWRDHAMKEHYNITWAVGDPPINLTNQNSVDTLLKKYLKVFKTYKCKNCGITRVSSYGFYAHIIVCGKTEEEIETYKELCNICNTKYLCVYKSQHMTYHREAELTKLRRQETEEKNKAAALMALDSEPEIVSGKRRAAQKAISVIGNISKEENQGKSGDFSDSDESVKMEWCSEASDEDDSDVDSNISDQEFEQRARIALVQKSHRSANDPSVEYAKTLPFEVENRREFLIKSGKDFAKRYHTEEELFPKWRPKDCEYLELNDENSLKYLPALDTSCNIQVGNDAITMKQFEVKKGPDRSLGCYLFAGATIRKLCWVPLSPGDTRDNYLTVVCHSTCDLPTCYDDEIVIGHGSVQLWNFRSFSRLPYLAMIMAHDYGIIWSVAWCPSGARDKILDNSTAEEPTNLRLGLMAAACSNGMAYIFAVPYPTNDEKTQFLKLKPVAELRLASKKDRRIFQATSICWSRHKGHDTIMVGYSDGCIASYDITSNSPLLTTEDKGVAVFYPYQDSRAHSGSITGVDVFPSPSGPGVLGWSSRLGAVLTAGGGRARRTHHPADHLFMSQHWPGAYVTGDAILLNAAAPNDVELWSNPRRLGLVHTLAECKCCGLVATFTTTQIRLMRPYPATNDIKKASFISIDVRHLEKKSKVKSDELGVVIEPLTYNDAIQKYGVKVKLFKTKSDIPVQVRPQDVCIERFPLSDVTSMDFCSSYEYHSRLAVGLHSGFIVLLNVG